MTRLTPLRSEDADAAQSAVIESILASRGDPASLIGPDGGLVGPFNAMAVSPHLGARIGALGQGVRFESSLEPRLKELAIITVGAHWKANFEWWAHAPLAQAAGIDVAVIEAIGSGTPPVFAREDESAVHAFVFELLDSGRVGEEAWRGVREHLEEASVVDLVTTVGYYCLISFTLNAFEVALPEGETPPWPY